MHSDEQIIKRNTGYIKTVANQYVGACRHLSFDDLVQEGVIGLLVAVHKGQPQSHYAQAIRHAIFRAITNQERAIRLPERVELDHRRNGTEYAVASVEYNDDYQGAAYDEYFAEPDEAEEDLAFLDILNNPLERAMILGVVIEDGTIRQIGIELGLSHKEATTRYNVGMAKLKRHYTKLGHKPKPVTRRIPFSERVLPLRGLVKATWLELHIIRERQIGNELMAIANNYSVSRDVVKRVCKDAIDGNLGHRGLNIIPEATPQP